MKNVSKEDASPHTPSKQNGNGSVCGLEQSESAKPARSTSFIKLMLVGILFYGSYGLANRRASQLANVPEIVFAWESVIPFWAWTIVPYWSLNLMYAAAFFLCRDTCGQNRHILRLLAAQCVATGCFLLFPLRFSWQKPPLDGWSGWLFGALAAFDLPYNQAPSLHIALVVIVGAFYWHRFPKIRLPLLVWSGLIALSVLTTYQHHFIDVPTGALLGCLVLWAVPYGGASPWRRQTGYLKTGGIDSRPDSTASETDKPQSLPPAQPSRPTPRHARFSLLYFIGAVAAALPALSGGGWLWLLWISVSLLLAAFAYLTGNAAVFQKQPNGRLSAAASALLLPYLVGVRLNIAFWLRGKPAVAQVRNDVFIGSISSARDGFPAVLDVCAEYPCSHRAAEYRTLPLLDMVAPSENDLMQAAVLLETLRQQHGKILVCCALGYGRSAAVMLTWLLAYGGCRNLKQALAELQQARPQIVLPQATAQAVETAAGYLKQTATPPGAITR